MLLHVVEIQIFYLVFCRMDFVIRILEVRFNYEGRRVARLRCGRMIRASIATFCQDVGYLAILRGR